MISNAHIPADLSRVKPFSHFATRFVLAVLATTAAIVLALHAFAPNSVSTGPATNDNAATTQVTLQPSEPMYVPGKPY